jgi:hypothetical protein
MAPCAPCRHPPAAMKKTLAASLFALSLFAACSGNAASTVPGTYELDKAKFKEAAMAQVPAEQKNDKAAMAMMDGMLNAMNMTVELKADGTMAATTPDGPETGTWKLDGDKITMTSKKGGKDETITGTYANGTITATAEEGGQKMTLVLVKKK